MVTNLWDKVSFFSGNCRFVGLAQSGPAGWSRGRRCHLDINSAGSSCFQKLLQRNLRPSSSHLLSAPSGLGPPQMPSPSFSLNVQLTEQATLMRLFLKRKKIALVPGNRQPACLLSQCLYLRQVVIINTSEPPSLCLPCQNYD